MAFLARVLGGIASACASAPRPRRAPVRTVAVALAMGAMPAYGQTPARVADASLEDLLAVEVTSVSKNEEALFRAPSAIAVLTGEDIRRAGATSVPEALRLVPGVQVATIDGGKWAVTARGFNTFYANKLLVLVDGRSIYNATTSGVHWSMQDVPVDEIERIEVIRGPGAALWGANAMNGVINIITKPARLTQGGTATVSTGSLDRGSISARYGDRLGDESYFRVYSTYTSLGATRSNDGSSAADAIRVGHAGFRVDTRVNSRDSITAAVSFSKGEIGQRQAVLTGILPPVVTMSTRPTFASGAAALVRWDRTLSSQSDFFVQATFDRSSRDETTAELREGTVNLEFQHHLHAGRHDMVWGFGQRLSSDDVSGSLAFSMVPAARRVTLTNAFAQNSITLVPDVLTATIGSKFEYSTAVGANAQPSVRVSYSPARRHNLWTAISHAVRTPSRLEQAMQSNFGAIQTDELPIVLRASGHSDVDAEHVTAYEAGYRVQLARRVHFDAATFYNRYHDLLQFAPYTLVEFVPAPVHLVVGQRYVNSDGAESYGAEALVRVQPLRRWMVEAAVTRLTAHIEGDLASISSTEAINGSSPTWQWHTASRLTLARNVDADATFYRVGAVIAAAAPAYHRLDLRLGWTRGPLGFSVAGQNLLHADHLEFDRIDAFVGSRVPRRATARMTWTF
jgi:iron complex outermembrane recepter protein